MHSVALAASSVNPLSPHWLIQTFGTLGVLAVIFAETGLLVGFFLPGDSLLFLAGMAASPIAAQVVGVSLPLPVLMIAAPVCAFAGAQLGYHLGARYGSKLFQRPGSRFFRPEFVDRAQRYFTRFGPGKAIILARFIAIVRTVLNPLAGVIGVPPRQFLRYNAIGAVLWTESVLLAGYIVARTLGASVNPSTVDNYVLPLIAVIIAASLTPIVLEVVKTRRRATEGVR